MQTAVPAIIATGSIPRFLDAIRKAGIPPKVDGNYLKSIGFKNTNDAALVPLFKSLGFLDSSGKPTSTFREYRGASADEAKRVLGSAITACYSGLFEVYPDAYRKDDEALTNWMRANTDKGEATQVRALKTFKALRDAASFDEVPLAPDIRLVGSPVPNGASKDGDVPGRVQYVRTQTTPDVTINISLQIAATNDASIYDEFFAAMKKHLFANES
jgi:hypothetical protein